MENEGFKDPKSVTSIVFYGKTLNLKKNITTIEPYKDILDTDAKEHAEAAAPVQEEENTA